MNLQKIGSFFKHSDILMSVGLVIVVGMMVLPLPSNLLDFLLTINVCKCFFAQLLDIVAL